MLHLIINAYWEPLEFELPPNKAWRRCVDTYLDPPDDIRSWADALTLQVPTCLVQPRSLILLLAGTN